MRKAGGSELYFRNSNVILRSLKLYNHREEGNCVLREEEAGEDWEGWTIDHAIFKISGSPGIKLLGRVVKHVDYLGHNYLNY